MPTVKSPQELLRVRADNLDRVAQIAQAIAQLDPLELAIGFEEGFRDSATSDQESTYEVHTETVRNEESDAYKIGHLLGAVVEREEA